MYSTNRYRYLWLGLIIGGLVLLFAMPAMTGFGGRHELTGAPGMWGWGFGWFGLIFRTLFWVGLIALVLGFFRRGRSGWYRDDHGEPPVGESSMEILKRRYAAGEISREEYDDMRQTLEASHA